MRARRIPDAVILLVIGVVVIKYLMMAVKKVLSIDMTYPHLNVHLEK